MDIAIINDIIIFLVIISLIIFIRLTVIIIIIMFKIPLVESSSCCPDNYLVTVLAILMIAKILINADLFLAISTITRNDRLTTASSFSVHVWDFLSSFCIYLKALSLSSSVLSSHYHYPNRIQRHKYCQSRYVTARWLCFSFESPRRNYDEDISIMNSFLSFFFYLFDNACTIEALQTLTRRVSFG